MLFSFLKIFNWKIITLQHCDTIHKHVEYWSGLPVLSSGDLPNPEIEPGTPAWQADSLPLGHLGSSSKKLSEPIIRFGF